MSELRESIKLFDLDQLNSLNEFISELISRKRHERTRTVWRVCSNGICHGNFREESYLNAAAYLSEVAVEIDGEQDSDRRDRQLQIVGERVPESEYESWFE